jgi:Zn-dependent peptidase ImmA (M78 family)
VDRGVVNFRTDPRIQPAQRDELRAFVSSTGQDIMRLAERLGLKVYAASLPMDQAGYLEYAPTCESSSGYRIIVNRDHGIERQRFTAAHEIAHFVLHRGTDNLVHKKELAHRYAYKVDYDDRARELEFEADEFAACLLMPAHLVRKYALYTAYTLDDLAELFGVSRHAMAKRLRDLGFPPYRSRISGVAKRMDPYGMLGGPRLLPSG